MTMFAKSSVTACILLAVLTATANETRTIADGVYTEAQAESGEALYAEHCLICHDKRYFRPVLKRWNGQPISMMYLIMSSSMPESAPASLSDEQYADILAYILSLSRYPAGDTPLVTGDAELERIIVAPRKR